MSFLTISLTLTVCQMKAHMSKAGGPRAIGFAKSEPHDSFGKESIFPNITLLRQADFSTSLVAAQVLEHTIAKGTDSSICRILEDGKKVRYLRKTGEVIDK